MPQDKAPADHPEHPSNLGRTDEQIRAEADAQAADLQRHQALIDKYRTLAELDAEVIPDRNELEQREALVLDAYEVESPDDPAAQVVIVDATGTTYRWVIADDTPDHWTQEEAAVPAAEEPQEADAPASATPESAVDLDAALAALDAGKGRRG